MMLAEERKHKSTNGQVKGKIKNTLERKDRAEKKGGENKKKKACIYFVLSLRLLFCIDIAVLAWE